MGAVRNSNTRASHASVEVSGAGAAPASASADSKGAGGSAGAPGAAASGAQMDSPHLGPDTPDRRPSFSYLRRASDRRRRRRMLERGGEEDVNSPKNQYREFVFPRNGNAQSESGQDSGDGGQRHAHGSDHHRLRRSDQINDDEGEQLEEYGDGEDEEAMGAEEQAARNDEEFGRHESAQYPKLRQQQRADEQRRQSINDRLTGAVSDVMEFVREESLYRRGKRRSLIRRRQLGLASGSGGAGTGSGSGTAGGPTDDAEFDSEELAALSGGGATLHDRSPNFRRRRVMRRSLRRSAQQQQQQRVYNDSDTGSAASLSHEHAVQQQQQQLAPHLSGQTHPKAESQRYKLQQHGGSVQDAHLLYGAPHRGTAVLVEQHRRHQSADAQPSNPHELLYYPQQHSEPHLIRPILVGASPPPAEAELARRERQQCALELEAHELEGGQQTAIHVGAELAKQPAGRFIAPKVAPLGSPSALLIPDEEIVPPNVPFRGRRLPQIPGSDIIRSAADFLHASVYGQRSRSVAAAAAASAIAATPLVTATGARFEAFDEAAESCESPAFPLVSESPTGNKRAEPASGASGIVKKPPTPLEPGSSLDASGSINFPRVSFSPTNSQKAAALQQKYHLTSGGPASLIATQAQGSAAAQSAVLATTNPGTIVSDPRSGSLAWTSLGRRAKKEDEDDWF